MTTVLVIDDDATSRAYVREMAPQEWIILEAADGLTGLDLARRQLQQLDLVVLDMHLPDMEGRLVCLRLRDLHPRLPILPFTGFADTVPVLAELPCLPPLLKPVRPADLAQALRAALHAAPAGVPAHPLVDWAQEQSSLVEQLLRQQQVPLRVAIYAASPIRRAGLVQILGNVAQTFEATHLPALERLLATMPWSALVADAAALVSVAPLVQRHNVPLVLVAATPAQALAVSTPEVAAVLLETDPAVAARLAHVVQALVAGECPPVYAFPTETGSVHKHVVPPMIARHFTDTPLTPRELDVLWLDYQGLTAAQIAQALTIDRVTVTSHWKRIQRKLGRDRQRVRAWVRERIQARERGTR